ncbi:hypothetical protein HanOQP8_Chr15g0574801 [Helianthus annuus]|nr:hypothetical protein HanLR1_Chr15g0577681 [Helianthus annuus]KAJ0652674.1 hypothetical protein HanOQP8_Chr15g0574801 [Helianthus annuus]KAJ0894494.1 hypothetical protein HanPSC8_Chr09g0389651 [Helianthus annuus]
MAPRGSCFYDPLEATTVIHWLTLEMKSVPPLLHTTISSSSIRKRL